MREEVQLCVLLGYSFGMFGWRHDMLGARHENIITPAIQRSDELFCICPNPNFEFAEPYFAVANSAFETFIRIFCCLLWLAVSINTSNSYGDFELPSRWFHFDLVYFENLERRIKCNLINPFRERLLRNSKSPVLNFSICLG